MAASILYIVNLAERKPRTQAEIAKAAGVTGSDSEKQVKRT